jgi:hypothetical protein
MIQETLAFYRDNPPKMLLLFLYLIALGGLLAIYSVYIDISFIYNRSSNHYYSIAVLSKSVLKAAIAIYGIEIIAQIVKNRCSINRIRLFLLIVLFSPWIIEIPFFMLSLLVEAPFFMLDALTKNFLISIIFVGIWLPIFIFSKRLSLFINRKE